MHLYETGRASQAKYYSPLLLNAILSLAALLDDEFDEGEDFYLKARLLIDIEVEEPRITTVQASAILGLFEANGVNTTNGNSLYSQNKYQNKTSVIDVSVPEFLGTAATSEWKPEIQRTRPFRSNLHIPVQENESVSLLFPNNSILQIAPPKWQPLRNPTTALRESETDGIEEDATNNYALINDVYGEDESMRDTQLVEAMAGANNAIKDTGDYNDNIIKGEDTRNTIYDKLMETMSGRIPLANSTAPATNTNTTTTTTVTGAAAEVPEDLGEGLPRDWSGYLHSVKTNNFN